MDYKARISQIKIILDTDIGDDIDDTWAISMLLKSKEVCVSLISTCCGKAHYRAALIAKILETANRTDIPIALGLDLPSPKAEEETKKPQQPWLEGFDLNSYPGHVHKKEDSINAIIAEIMSHSQQTNEGQSEFVTLLCIGPLTNIAAALEIEPKIADHARIVAMAGSVYKGYDGSSKVCVEYNIKRDIHAAQKVFNTKWRGGVVLAPLDTCGLIKFEGAKWQRLLKCAEDDQIMIALLENYAAWRNRRGLDPDISDWKTIKESSVLFDTLAAYLTFKSDHLVMEDLPIAVNNEGYTIVDRNACNIVSVAVKWTNLPAFKQFLIDRLRSPVVRNQY